MSWVKEFKKACDTAILKNGSPVTEGSQTWGWQHEEWEDIRDHVRKDATPPTVGSMDDITWYEGADTFTDGYPVKGIEVPVTCGCGKWSVQWRWDGTLSDVIKAVLDAADEEE